jgi:hypothetical protein
MAQSTVFERMFTLNTKEKATSTVEITDITAKAIQGMLEYVRTKGEDGNVMEEDYVEELYEAADKYALDDLKVSKHCIGLFKH